MNGLGVSDLPYGTEIWLERKCALHAIYHKTTVLGTWNLNFFKVS
jgi:hypothetical protein